MTFGIGDTDRAAIGDLPRGRGILGVLIEDARPLRLDDLMRDPRAVGFPPNHPPMRSFLGVPVMTRGVAFGNLYLAEKQPEGSFTDEDEEIVDAARGAGRRGDRERRQRAARRTSPRRPGAGGGAEAARPRAARRDGPGADVDPARPRGRRELEDGRGSPCRRRRPSGLVVDTLQSVRRLAVELRPSALDDFGLEPALRRLGETVARAAPRRAGRDEAGRSAAPAGRRDRALPHRAGGAHERGQACRREPRQHRRHPQGDGRAGDDRGRRQRDSIPAHDPSAGSGCSACASGSSSSTGRWRSTPRPGAGTTLIVELPLV